LIIGNIAASRSFHPDTLSTLQFASKSRKIVNRPVTNTVAPVLDISGERKRDLERWRAEQETKRRKGLPLKSDSKQIPAVETTESKSALLEINERIRKLEEKLETTTTEAPLKLQPKVLPAVPQTPAPKRLHGALMNKSHVLPEAPSSMVQMTPCTKATLTNSYVQQAEVLRKQQLYRPALHLYQNALANNLDESSSARLHQRIEYCQRKLKQAEITPLETNSNVHSADLEDSLLTSKKRRRHAKTHLATKKTRVVDTSSDLDLDDNDSVKQSKFSVKSDHLDEEDQENCPEGDVVSKGQSRVSDGSTADEQISAFIRHHHSIAECLLSVLNSGELKKIRTLSGIGDRRAQQILDHCKVHGSLVSVHALRNIPGFGSRTLQRLLEALVADQEKSALDDS
jgi:DNA uptake protein ComE-like DNA-binding protein